MRLSTNEEHCDARNNILYITLAGNKLSMLDADGVLDLHRNWVKAGWVGSFGTLTGTINDDGTSIQTAAPGFVNEASQDFSLTPNSPCLNVAVALHPSVLPDGAITRQYVKHQSSIPRPVIGAASDLGAFELIPQGCAGDLDCDNDRDMSDIPAFVLALLDPVSYAATYPGCDITRADMNGDLSINGRDIVPFSSALISGPCP
jgi:hypothetical protein